MWLRAKRDQSSLIRSVVPLAEVAINHPTDRNASNGNFFHTTHMDGGEDSARVRVRWILCIYLLEINSERLKVTATHGQILDRGQK